MALRWSDMLMGSLYLVKLVARLCGDLCAIFV